MDCFFLRELIIGLPQLVSSFLFLFESNQSEFTWYTIIGNCFSMVFYGFLIFLFLFKTNSILDKLHLDKGMDEELFLLDNETKQAPREIIINSTLVLTVSLLVTTGVILINEIPKLFNFLYLYSTRSINFENIDNSLFIVAIVKILISLLLIGEHKRIIGFIQGRQVKEIDDK